MKKAILVYGVPVVIAVVLFVLIKIYDPFSYKFTQINLDDYLKLNEDSKGTELVYVYNDDQESGKIYSNIIKSVMENKQTKVYALDYNTLNSEEKIQKFIDANEVVKSAAENNEGYTVPMVLLLEDGEVKASLMGTVEKNNFEMFVKSNKLK